MPATSKKQRRLMAIAEHHAAQVKNRGGLDMSKGQLHDFAATSEKGLPGKKPNPSTGLRVKKMHAPRARFGHGRKAGY